MRVNKTNSARSSGEIQSDDLFVCSIGTTGMLQPVLCLSSALEARARAGSRKERSASCALHEFVLSTKLAADSDGVQGTLKSLEMIHNII